MFIKHGIIKQDFRYFAIFLCSLRNRKDSQITQKGRSFWTFLLIAVILMQSYFLQLRGCDEKGVPLIVSSELFVDCSNIDGKLLLVTLTHCVMNKACTS